MTGRKRHSGPDNHVPTIEQVAVAHAKFIRSLLLRFHVERADVDDVAQAVLRVTSKKLATFEPAESEDAPHAILGLLVRICERQAADYRRSLAKRRSVILATIDTRETEQVESPAPDPEAQMIAAEREALLSALLEALPPKSRAVVLAYEIDGNSMAEVASMLGIPVNTGWNRRRLGLRDARAAWQRRKAQRR